jgi:DNA-binding transcriptional ArsR family regulator
MLGPRQRTGPRPPSTLCQLTLTLVVANVSGVIDQTLHALAEPRRREILGLLAADEMAAGAIAARFDVTRPAVSQHLAVLRAAGLVSERRDGTRRLYRARPAGLEPLRTWLGRFWDDNLQRLRVAAEAEMEGD